MTGETSPPSPAAFAPRPSGARTRPDPVGYVDVGYVDVAEWMTVPGQVEIVGGGAPTAIAAILVFFVAVVLSVAVTYRYARGYLRTRHRPLLYLTAGMLLLAPAPMFIRLVVGNVAAVSPTERTLVVTASKLCGLLAILAVVHRS